MPDDQRKLLLPDGNPASPSDEAVTERGVDRLAEDQRFVPVIIKRTDETRPHPDDILQRSIAEGLEQIRRRAVSLVLSSVAAGLILGFTAMAVAVVRSTEQLPVPHRVAMAVVYPLGFILCILSGSQLFTEHTATAVYPVLDRKSSLGPLLRLWGLVIGGNLVGAFVSAGLLTLTDEVIQARDGYLAIGAHLVGYTRWSLLVSSILAGWLMALGAWLLRASPQAISQIVCIYIVTFLIGLGGLHHSIAGAVEIFAAALASASESSPFTPAAIVQFLGIALIGNLIGGSCFVAVLNYAHIRKTQARHNSHPTSSSEEES